MQALPKTDNEVLAEWAAIVSRVIEREIRPHAVRGVRELPSIKVSIPYPPPHLHAKAKALLAASGWANASDLWTCFPTRHLEDGLALEGVSNYWRLTLHSTTPFSLASNTGDGNHADRQYPSDGTTAK